MSTSISTTQIDKKEGEKEIEFLTKVIINGQELEKKNTSSTNNPDLEIPNEPKN